MEDKITHIRAGDINSNRVKHVLINGVQPKDAIHYVDTELQYAVAWDEELEIATPNRDRDYFKIIHGKIEIVWKDT